MRIRTAACLLLALTACSGGSDPAPRATGATAAPSTPASSAPPATIAPSAVSSPSPVISPGAKPLVVAVADKKGGLSLYAVPPGEHAAALLRRFEPPAKKVVVAVSLSAAPAATVCAIWRSEPPSGTPNELICYSPDVYYGERVLSKNASRGVSVRGDGRAVAWTENEANPDLVVADFDGDVAKERTRLRYAPAPPPGGLPEGLADVDWVGPRRIAVNDVADDDEGKGLCLVDVDKPRAKTAAGFAPCVKPGPAEQRAGYAYFEEAAGVSDTEVLAIERAKDCFCDDLSNVPGARAVRLRLTDGAVLGVLATPRPGRDVVDISGSDRALLYMTAGKVNYQPTLSLRWAGEPRGAPLTGLPADLLLATAQP
ncbi:MAG: hypothetical protein QOE05_1669 [Actinomycetota bacterium]|jgi:hypothetical protein|nr:hypothetical protein [Actinomycetota bacterium]